MLLKLSLPKLAELELEEDVDSALEWTETTEKGEMVTIKCQTGLFLLLGIVFVGKGPENFKCL